MLDILGTLFAICYVVFVIYAIKSPSWKANRRISPNGLDYAKMNQDLIVEGMSKRDVALKQLRGEYDK